MLRLLFLLTAFITLSSTGTVTYTDCGHKEVTIVDVSGCSSGTCSVKAETNFTTSATFVANQDSSYATLAISLQLGGVEMALPLHDDDMCRVTTLACPLKKGQTYTITRNQTVDSILAGTNPVITGTLIGDNGVLFCASVPLTVVA